MTLFSVELLSCLVLSCPPPANTTNTTSGTASNRPRQAPTYLSVYFGSNAQVLFRFHFLASLCASVFLSLCVCEWTDASLLSVSQCGTRPSQIWESMVSGCGDAWRVVEVGHTQSECRALSLFHAHGTPTTTWSICQLVKLRH